MISIITINLNNSLGLEKTILSIQNQSYKIFEHIIIDGESTDDSAKIIEKYKNKIKYSVSEPDTGVYNAMNKGIKVSTGKYVIFLNSGDVFSSNDILNELKIELENSDFDIYYGDVNLINENLIVEHRIFPDKLSFSFFLNKTITHQVSLIKRSLFDEIFYYNENFKLISDWEFFICAICKYNKLYKHLNLTIANYDINGMSSLNENINVINNERKVSLKQNFPLFLEDYKLMEYSNKILNSFRFKTLLKLERYKSFNSLINLYFKLLLFLIKLKDKI